MRMYDNFLPDEEFMSLQNLLLGTEFPWYYNKFVNYEGESGDHFQFTHCFYRASMGKVVGGVNSEFAKILEKFITRLNINSLVQVKANMNPRTSVLENYPLHIDCSLNCNTAIFYLNTNDGYTIFENDVKIESVANRLVVFDSNLKHAGTSCTNTQVRVLLNFNYF